MIWITADTHFGHTKILVYEKDARPFNSVEEMNEALIANWNKVVKAGDVVYHVGDFGFTRKLNLDPFNEMKNLLNRLNGSINLNFIFLGNPPTL